MAAGADARRAGGWVRHARVDADVGAIEESFRRRLAELPAPTQRFLTVAAAEPTGDPVIVWRAARALGVGPEDAAPRSTPDSSRSASRCGSDIPSYDPRPTARPRSPIARQHIANSRRQPIPTSIPIDARGTARSDHPVPTKTSPRRSSTRSAAREPGGLAAAAALLERSVALTLDPSKRTGRILAAAAAHLEAGSFESTTKLLSLAEATPLDDMASALVDALRGQHAATSGDIRRAPEPFLRGGAAVRVG